MIYIGIDPGLTGAVAMILPDGTTRIFDTPTLQVKKSTGKNKNTYVAAGMKEILKELAPGEAMIPWERHVIIEQVHAMPGQGVTSMFSMGYGLGLWEGMIVGIGYPITRVSPREWKKVFGLNQDKNASVVRARELFPQADISLKKHHGRAEALLMAEYLRRTLHSNE